MPALEPTPRFCPRLSAALTSLSTCVGLVTATLGPALVPTPAQAAPAEEPAAAPAEAPNAEAIFRRGQAKYETADYNGAIELWTEAYALVDSTPENASIKALIIYNLAQAHLEAFDLDQDTIHLKQALRLLESYRKNLDLLYEDTEAIAAERQTVDDRIAELEAAIAEAEAEPEPEPDEPDEPPPPADPSTDPGPVDAPPSGKALVITGGVLLGLGAAMLGTGIAGGLIGASANDISELMPGDTAGREDQFALGRAANGMAFLGYVGGGVFIATGAALLGVGVKRNKQRARAGVAGLRLSPTINPGRGGGLTISGRF